MVMVHHPVIHGSRNISLFKLLFKFKSPDQCIPDELCQILDIYPVVVTIVPRAGGTLSP